MKAPSLRSLLRVRVGSIGAALRYLHIQIVDAIRKGENPTIQQLLKRKRGRKRA